MPGEDLFLTVAELAIALAGFTGVVVVFAHRGGTWAPVDAFRIRGALWTSIGAAFFAIVPSGLHLLGLSGTVLWRVSSGLFVAYGLAPMLLGQRVDSLDAESRSLLAVTGRSVIIFLSFGGLLVHLANTIGIRFDPQVGVYFLGLFLYLVLAAFLFVRIIFVRPS